MSSNLGEAQRNALFTQIFAKEFRAIAHVRFILIPLKTTGNRGILFHESVSPMELLTEFKDHSPVQDILNQSEVDLHTGLLFPASISELTNHLILTSASSVNQSVLNILNIKCIVNVAPELPDIPHNEDILYHKIQIVDSSSSRIYPCFDEAADLIHKIAGEGGRTLVYCVAGVSRSASVCLAYLMKHQRMSLLEAFNYVKRRRNRIKPNCGFFKQLIEYEKSLFGVNTVRMVFNEFVRMEIPDVYDCEYQFVHHLGKKWVKTGRH